MRVPGHELWGEGAPYEWMNARWMRVNRGKANVFSVAGTGKAVCSCKKTSKVLTSSTQRKAWHRKHKAEVIEQTKDGWHADRVRQAFKAYGMLGVPAITTDAQGNVQVRMSFETLCSFAESICGSMSGFDFTGYVQQELARYESLLTTDEALRRRNGIKN